MWMRVTCTQRSHRMLWPWLTIDFVNEDYRGAGRLWLALAAAVAIAVGLVVWIMRPPQSAAPQARQYLNTSACLLTPQSGIALGDAAPVWTSMESASLATHVMVSYLPAAGPADVTVVLNTLIERDCGVI